MRITTPYPIWGTETTNVIFRHLTRIPTRKYTASSLYKKQTNAEKARGQNHKTLRWKWFTNCAAEDHKIFLHQGRGRKEKVLKFFYYFEWLTLWRLSRKLQKMSKHVLHNLWKSPVAPVTERTKTVLSKGDCVKKN